MKALGEYYFHTDQTQCITNGINEMVFFLFFLFLVGNSSFVVHVNYDDNDKEDEMSFCISTG